MPKRGHVQKFKKYKIRSPKQGYQWPPKMELRPTEILKSKQKKPRVTFLDWRNLRWSYKSGSCVWERARRRVVYRVNF